MAKTLWVDGSNLTPAQMIAFFGNSAVTGHTHDGANLDGSVPKVNLAAAAHVTGLLPIANVDDISEGTVAVKITTSFFTVQQTATFDWMKINDNVIIFLDQMFGTSNSTGLEVTPVTVWPAAIVPASQKVTPFLPLHDTNKWRPGMIAIPNNNSSNWVLYITDTNGDHNTTGFVNTGTKGISRQSILYTV